FAPPTITAEALLLLQSHPFPGNVRELENLAHRLQHAGENPLGPDLVAGLLGSGLESGGMEPALASSPVLALKETPKSYGEFKKSLQNAEKAFLSDYLEKCRFVVADAAKSLAMTRTALHNRMAKL